MNGEFLFKKAELIEWQKWLNQWRHQYELIIHSCLIEGNNVTILLERREKKS